MSDSLGRAVAESPFCAVHRASGSLLSIASFRYLETSQLFRPKKKKEAMAAANVHVSADVESAINLAVRFKFPNVNLRPEQRDGLKFILEGKDVVALLPTGYGKSLLYQVLPTIHHTLEQSRRIVAVVTPLKAIMVQQTMELRKKGIRTVCLGQSDNEDQMIRDCAVDIVFGSAEVWLSDKWKRELLTGDLGKAISEIFVNEAHTVIEWYEYLHFTGKLILAKSKCCID